MTNKKKQELTEALEAVRELNLLIENLTKLKQLADELRGDEENEKIGPEKS